MQEDYANNNLDVIEAQSGNQEAMQKLIDRNKGLIWSIVKRFQDRGYELEDLYQVAVMGFIKCIKRFDASFEVQLTTYAVPYILGEVKRYLRDDGPVKISRSIKELAMKALEEQKEYVYRTLCQKSSIFRLANGLPQFLDELSRRKILVNIATASGHTNVRFFFGQLALGRWFDLRRVVLNDGTFPCKPAPDIFLRAAEKLGLPPAGCAIFEDSRAGIQSACRAGAGLVVGVSSMLPAEELYTLGAKAVISDYRDLPELLRLLGCC